MIKHTVLLTTFFTLFSSCTTGMSVETSLKNSVENTSQQFNKAFKSELTGGISFPEYMVEDFKRRKPQLFKTSSTNFSTNSVSTDDSGNKMKQIDTVLVAIRNTDTNYTAYNDVSPLGSPVKFQFKDVPAGNIKIYIAAWGPGAYYGKDDPRNSTPLDSYTHEQYVGANSSSPINLYLMIPPEDIIVNPPPPNLTNLNINVGFRAGRR